MGLQGIQIIFLQVMFILLNIMRYKLTKGDENATAVLYMRMRGMGPLSISQYGLPDHL